VPNFPGDSKFAVLAYLLAFAVYATQIFACSTSQHTTERYITLVIAKKGPHEHWPRLLKAAGKPAPNIKASLGLIRFLTSRINIKLMFLLKAQCSFFAAGGLG
jgi:hypothetical protein